MKNIIFIHGMFQNPKSWENWITYFSAKGYNCIAPAWPYHEGEPAYLRQSPDPELGELELETIIDDFQDIAARVEDPILIGHSVGGLIVQILINRGFGKAGVCIDSVAPNALLSFDWGFFKNSLLIVNPFKDDTPFYTDLESFHESFCNTMTMEETQKAFDAYATHDSRNVLRDCMGEAGKVDFDLPHAPLLFIAGEEDKIIPADLNEKNSDAYTDEGSLTYFEKFPNRGHFICGQPGWEEVAESVADWLQREEVSGGGVTLENN
jgi:pimeloyl-ACP methyl ester carboxylesterase